MKGLEGGKIAVVDGGDVVQLVIIHLVFKEVGLARVIGVKALLRALGRVCLSGMAQVGLG